VQTRLGETISVGDFGAVSDNVTDSTKAFAAAFAFAAANHGTKITVPCSGTGHYYLITAPLTLPSYTTIEGSNSSECMISYNPPPGRVTVAAVLNGIGATFVSIRHLRIITSSSAPPNSILMLGRIHSTDGSGGHHFQDLVLGGYVNAAVVYSIASETNTWDDVQFIVQGGNAVAAFYTSSQDYLGICAPACAISSNLSLFMSHFRAALYGGNPAAAVMDNLGGGTGDHVYRDGYISAGTTGDGFEFVSSGGSGPNTPVQVSSVRIENGKYAVHFVKGTATYLSQIDIRNVTQGNTTNILMYGDTGLTLMGFRFEQNSTGAVSNAGSSLDRLEDSYVEEHYGTITIRTSARLNILIGEGIPGVNGGGFALPQGSEDENLIIGLKGNGATFTPPATVRLRRGGTGSGSAWGPSLNLPDASGHCTTQVGDICSVAHQPEYYDGTAARKMLLGGVAQFSDLDGTIAASQLPPELTQLARQMSDGSVISVAHPSCDASHEGRIFYTTGTPGQWRFCMRDASGNYTLHFISLGK